jgi:hypothetical protein
MSKEADKKVKALQLDLKQVSRGYSILNENQVQKLFNSTPNRWTYSRDGKAGQKWRYVKRGYVRRTLDSVFGFNWDFAPETSVAEAYEVAKITGSVIVKGTLTARVLDTRGQQIAELTKGDFGRADVKFKKELDALGQKVPLDFGNDLKAATTDCFKRCAMWLGVAADVYDPEEFLQIEVVGSEENSERDKNTQNMIKKAKKSLQEPGKEVAK